MLRMLFLRDSKDRLSNSLFNEMRIVAIDSNYSVSLKHTFSTKARVICFFYVWRAYVSDYISRCTLYNIMHSKWFLVWISYLVIYLLLNYCNALVWNGRFIMSMWICEKRLVWSKQHAHHTQSLNNLSTFYFLLFIRIVTISEAVISKAHSNFECVC